MFCIQQAVRDMTRLPFTIPKSEPNAG